MSSTKKSSSPKAARAEFSPGDIIVEGRITAPAKQLFNLLLKKAFHQNNASLNTVPDKTKTEHEILTNDIQNEIPEIQNLDFLRETLNSLSVRVRYNITDLEGKHRRGFFIMLPQAEMDENREACRYAFSPKMLALMINPAFSAKMSLLLRRRHKGGEYRRLIYELCFKHKETGQTPFISVDALKSYLEVGKDAYPEFKIFNRDLLKPVIKEINKQTDLRLTLNTRRTGRKITHLSFSVVVKTTPRPASVSVASSGLSEKQNKSETKEKLTSLGVSENLAENLKQIHSLKYLKLAAEVLEKYQTKNSGKDTPPTRADKILSKIIRMGQRKLTAGQNPRRQSGEKIDSVREIEARHQIILKKIGKLNRQKRKKLKKFVNDELK